MKKNNTSSLYASPQEAITTLLNHYWADRSDDEHPYLLWANYLADYTEQAKLWLDEINYFLENPGENFVEIIQENGNVFLPIEDSSAEEVNQAYQEWMKNLSARMSAMYNDYIISPQCIFKQFLIRFHYRKSYFSMLEEWRNFAKEEPGQALTIHQSMKAYLKLGDRNLAEMARKWGWIELPLQDGMDVADVYFTWLTKLIGDTEIS